MPGFLIKNCLDVLSKSVVVRCFAGCAVPCLLPALLALPLLEQRSRHMTVSGQAAHVWLLCLLLFVPCINSQFGTVSVTELFSYGRHHHGMILKHGARWRTCSQLQREVAKRLLIDSSVFSLRVSHTSMLWSCSRHDLLSSIGLRRVRLCFKWNVMLTQALTALRQRGCFGISELLASIALTRISY